MCIHLYIYIYIYTHTHNTYIYIYIYSPAPQSSSPIIEPCFRNPEDPVVLFLLDDLVWTSNSWCSTLGDATLGDGHCITHAFAAMQMRT